LCPEIEKYIVEGGIQLIKLWLEVGQDEQERRFMARISDPLRQWKLSPMDLESYRRWHDYSRARDTMLEKSHIMSLIPYEKVPEAAVELPKRSGKRKYDDRESLKGRHVVAQKY
jgi:polyphosphate kinase